MKYKAINLNLGRKEMYSRFCLININSWFESNMLSRHVLKRKPQYKLNILGRRYNKNTTTYNQLVELIKEETISEYILFNIFPLFFAKVDIPFKKILRSNTIQSTSLMH